MILIIRNLYNLKNSYLIFGLIIFFLNSKIRICQQCLQNRETASESTKIEDKTEEDIFTNDSNDDDDPDINFEVRSEKLSKGGQLDEAFTIVSKEDIK